MASRSGPWGGLLMLLVLAASGPPVAGQEPRDRAEVIGPRGNGESWRAPDARVVRTVVIRPVPQPMFRESGRKLGQPAAAGDFWTPEQLRRVQPPRGSFRAPSERD